MVTTNLPQKSKSRKVSSGFGVNFKMRSCIVSRVFLLKGLSSWFFACLLEWDMADQWQMFKVLPVVLMEELMES